MRTPKKRELVMANTGIISRNVNTKAPIWVWVHDLQGCNDSTMKDNLIFSPIYYKQYYPL